MLLEIRNLKTYFFTSRGIVKAVDDVSLSLDEGQVLGLAGESGCGKSTLAYSIIRLIPPPGLTVGGKILFENTDILELDNDTFRKEYRMKKISMVFQGAMQALTPVYTVGEQLYEVFKYHMDVNYDEAKSLMEEQLKSVALDPSIMRRYPHELSGGQKQRVMIAMALLLKPKLVIADEPTTALDVIVQAQILNLLKQLQSKYGTSMILISHDLSIIAELADKVGIMYAGKLVEIAPALDIYKDPLHPYTQKLLKSIPRLKQKVEKLEFIPGVPPDLRNPPSGCRFHPRCPYVMDICKKVEPQLVEIKPNHYVACHLYSEGGKR
ncbi:MAG TPA: ABC transporter ATP-binding protein [Geobacterales bacterium]|nr:ABC transporter ATP-binding protein [Geobacterales bacterium]